MTSRVASLLYERAPAWLQTLAVSGAGAYLAWERTGGEFPALLAAAEAATFATPEELRAIRERLFRERVRPAAAEVAAYGHRLLDLDELRSLPVIDKAEVRRRMAAFVRAGHARLARVQGRTSGTTGAGLRFPATRFALRRALAYVWRFRRWHGIDRGEWCGVFGGRVAVPPSRRAPPYWKVNAPGRTVLFSQYHLAPETVRAYVDEIRARRLRWLHGYPSVVALLARFALDAGLGGTTDVRFVTLASETLLDGQRHDIERMFGVAPRQQYALAEAVARISECPLGRLHVDEDYANVELVPDRIAPGAHRIVGTTLDNEVFPLLRYDPGDLVRLGDGAPCRCGRSGRIVDAIDGRQEDLLVLADGARVGRSAFFKDAVNVAEAQLVQRRAGEATLRIVRGPAWREADEAALRADVHARVGDRLRLAFEYVEALPRTASGKLRLVVSELPEGRAAGAAR